MVRDLLRRAARSAGVSEGVGLDATSATVIPADKSGYGHIHASRFESSPHAYIKLWKHHGAKIRGKDVQSGG